MTTKQYLSFGIFSELLSVPVRIFVYFKEGIRLIYAQLHT